MSFENNDESDYVSGDNTCYTCLGVTYYDKAMQTTNSPVKCYGFKGTTDEKIDPDLRIHQKTRSPEFESYCLIGRGVWSGIMERTGLPPVKISGIEFVATKELKKDKNEVRNKVLRERHQALLAKNAALDAEKAAKEGETN